MTKRKITGLVLLKNHPDLVVKIADTREGKNAIHCESAALKDLYDCQLGGMLLPQLLLENEWEGYLIQVQSYLTTQKGKQSTTLTNLHLTILTALTHLNRRFLLFSETTYYQIIEQLALQQELRLPREIKELITDVLSENSKKHKFLCHRVHGDFAPWNIKAAPDGLMIWDWEDSISDGIVFTDIFHFIIRNAILIGPWSGVDEILQKIKTACSTLQTKATLPVDIDFTISLQIWIALEFLRNPHPKLLEIAASLKTTHHD